MAFLDVSCLLSRRRSAVLAIVAAAASAITFGVVTASPASAAGSTINVNTTTDEDNTGPGCSVREAFLTIDNGSGYGGCTIVGSGSPFTVDVPAGTYALTLGELRPANLTNLTMSIVGAGASSTILRQDTSNSRVMNVNRLHRSGVHVAISGIAITSGSTNVGAGGGGLLGGGLSNSLTLSQCAFSDNESISPSTPQGGAIELIDGDLIIDSCTFTNNQAKNSTNNLGVGGAIDYQLGSSDDGWFDVEGSVFIGNIAATATTGAGGAIAIRITTSTTIASPFIERNVFDGNQASAGSNGHGGAILDANGQTSIIRFNRFDNNVASGLGTAIFKASTSAGSVNAEDNWFGCNGGAGATGCETIDGATAQVDSVPFLKLTHAAASPTLAPGTATTLTASFTTDSAGIQVSGGNLMAIQGTTVTFDTAVNGTISAAQPTIQTNGKATATFTAGAVCGPASARATNDNQFVDVALTVTCGDSTPPDTFIDTHPTDPTTSTSATFTYHGTDNIGVATYECRLDSGAFGASAALSGLSVGQHTLQVRAKDAAGNIDPTPATFTWTVSSTTGGGTAGGGTTGGGTTGGGTTGGDTGGGGTGGGGTAGGGTAGGGSGVVDYIPLAPARLADTRPGASTVDTRFAGGGPRPTSTTLELTVAGRGGVPTDAIAVALNVTAVDPAGSGYVTVFPCGQSRPNASNVNFRAGATVPNSVFAKLSTDGKVCVFSSQTTDLVVDLAGAFPATSRYLPSNPARVLDTRNGSSTVDGKQQGGGPAALGSVTVLHLAGRAGIPLGVDSVVLNLTATDSSAAGFVTAYPCDAPRPNSSNLNLASTTEVANLVVAKAGANGDVCLYTSQPTQLIADVNGYLPAATSFATVVPGRLLDTRTGGTTIDGAGAANGFVAAGSTTRVHVSGRAGVRATATTVLLNVTITESQGPGYATVFPCGIEPPLASNVNFIGGQTVSNSAIVKIGTGGDICVSISQPTQMIVDVLGDVA